MMVMLVEDLGISGQAIKGVIIGTYPGKIPLGEMLPLNGEMRLIVLELGKHLLVKRTSLLNRFFPALLQ